MCQLSMAQYNDPCQKAEAIADHYASISNLHEYYQKETCQEFLEKKSGPIQSE